MSQEHAPPTKESGLVETYYPNRRKETLLQGIGLLRMCTTNNTIVDPLTLNQLVMSVFDDVDVLVELERADIFQLACDTVMLAKRPLVMQGCPRMIVDMLTVLERVVQDTFMCARNAFGSACVALIQTWVDLMSFVNLSWSLSDALARLVVATGHTKSSVHAMIAEAIPQNTIKYNDILQTLKEAEKTVTSIECFQIAHRHLLALSTMIRLGCRDKHDWVEMLKFNIVALVKLAFRVPDSATVYACEELCRVVDLELHYILSSYTTTVTSALAHTILSNTPIPTYLYSVTNTPHMCTYNAIHSCAWYALESATRNCDRTADVVSMLLTLVYGDIKIASVLLFLRDHLFRVARSTGPHRNTIFRILRDEHQWALALSLPADALSTDSIALGNALRNIHTPPSPEQLIHLMTTCPNAVDVLPAPDLVPTKSELLSFFCADLCCSVMSYLSVGPYLTVLKQRKSPASFKEQSFY